MRKFYYSLVVACENFQIGYVIGYDPCSGVLDPNNEEVGFVISIPSKKDTIVPYDFPKNIYDFPAEYFNYYKSYCMFPDSAWDDFQIKLKYRDRTKYYVLDCLVDQFNDKRSNPNRKSEIGNLI